MKTLSSYIFIVASVATFLVILETPAREGSGSFEFSIEALERHQQSYKELTQKAGVRIPMEDGYFSGACPRSASTMSNGISFLIGIEELLSDISNSVSQETLEVLEGVVAQQYYTTLGVIQMRYKAGEGMQQFANSPLTIQFLKEEMQVDEQCYQFMQARLLDLLGEDDPSGEKAAKVVNEALAAILANQSEAAAEAVEISKLISEFGKNMNQKSARLMTENVLSSEMGDAPYLVGYVGQDYNAINRNASFLVCNETLALVVSDRGPKKVRTAAMENLLIAHLKYFLKTKNRIDALYELMMIHRENTALIARLQDLQGDLSTARGFSEKRIEELLRREGLRESLGENTQSFLIENGL